MCSLTVADHRGTGSGELIRYLSAGQTPGTAYGSDQEPAEQQQQPPATAAAGQGSSDAETVSTLRRVVSSQRVGGGNWEAETVGSSDYGIYSFPSAYSSDASVGGYGSFPRSISFTGQKRVREEETLYAVTGNDSINFEEIFFTIDH